MYETAQFLKAWKVRQIVVLPENQGVEVTFSVEGHDPICFRTRKFGIGRRGAKSAALAKFASQAGYGEVKEVFNYVSGLPSDMVGNIFAAGPLGFVTDRQAPTELRCVWPREEVA
jgi:hypothetical protein